MQARALAIAAASMHLQAGRDVIVPQYLGRVDFILELARLANVVAASFVEIALAAEPADAAERFRLRSDDPQCQTHRDAALLLSHDDTAAWSQMRDRLIQVLAARPGTVVIRSSVGEIDQSFAALERALRP